MGPSVDRYERGDVGMNCGEASIERCELPAATACEMTQIRVRDLSMADESGDDGDREWLIVGPEFVAGQTLYPTERRTDVSSCVTGTQEVANERSLSDRARCEALVSLAEPVAGGFVMYVIGVDERDQDVRVK